MIHIIKPILIVGFRHASIIQKPNNQFLNVKEQYWGQLTAAILLAQLTAALVEISLIIYLQ